VWDNIDNINDDSVVGASITSSANGGVVDLGGHFEFSTNSIYEKRNSNNRLTATTMTTNNKNITTTTTMDTDFVDGRLSQEDQLHQLPNQPQFVNVNQGTGSIHLEGILRRRPLPEMIPSAIYNESTNRQKQQQQQQQQQPTVFTLPSHVSMHYSRKSRLNKQKIDRPCQTDMNLWELIKELKAMYYERKSMTNLIHNGDRYFDRVSRLGEGSTFGGVYQQPAQYESNRKIATKSEQSTDNFYDDDDRYPMRSLFTKDALNVPNISRIMNIYQRGFRVTPNRSSCDIYDKLILERKKARQHRLSTELKVHVSIKSEVDAVFSTSTAGNVLNIRPSEANFIKDED